MAASDVDFDLVSLQVRENSGHVPLPRRLGYAMSLRTVVI
jgi:hypothetical protein